MNDGADETCPGGWGEGCEVGEDDKKEKPMSEAYQVTPSVGVNIRSGPGTGYSKVGAYAQEIGRASCRERVSSYV